jgi:hypothetical protein
MSNSTSPILGIANLTMAAMAATPLAVVIAYLLLPIVR